METDMKLNEQQTKAVTTSGNHVLVLAGPGAGKTRVLVERVAYLLEEQCFSGYDILMLTFTRKSAQEMKERIVERVGESLARKITIGTFHGVCLRILKECGSYLGYNSETLSVYDDIDQKDVLDDIIAGYHKKIDNKILSALINEFRIKGPIVIDMYKDLYPSECRIFSEYRNRLKENNAVDYGLILTEVQRLFVSYPEVRQRYQTRWKHILVDEYQDTDTMQYNLHSLIDPLYLFCVGDSDQAIYLFRGASMQIMLDFGIDYFDSEIIELSGSYRCAKSIVSAANNLIKMNTIRYDNSIFAYRSYEGEIRIDGYETPEDEADDVADSIRYAIAADIPMSEIAVLSRTRKPLQLISSELDRINIPNIVIGKRNDFLNEPAVKLFHSFLSLIVNPMDNLAFCRVKRLLDIDDTEYQQIRLSAVQDEIGHLAAYLKRYPDGWWLESIIKECGNNLLLWKNHICDCDVLGSLQPDVEAFILKWSEENGTKIQDYLDWIQQRDIQDEIQDNEDVVKLMTIHAAKGLEFQYVIVIDANEGNMPHSRAKTPEAIEEERRLCYVAITRAKDRLAFTQSANKMVYGQRMLPATPSRFLREIQ